MYIISTVVMYVTVSVVYSMGPMFSLFPYPLYYEVAEFSASSTLVSNVSTGMEVQGVKIQI